MRLNITECIKDGLRYLSFKCRNKQIAKIYYPNQFHNQFVVELSYCHLSAHAASLDEANMLLNSDL